MLKTRVITALAILPILLGALFFLPYWGWGIFTLLIVSAGCWEWSRFCSFPRRAALVYLALSAVLLALGLACYLDALAPLSMDHAARFAFPLAAIFWFVAVPLWLRAGWRPRPWIAGIAGWFVLIPAWVAFLLLRNAGAFLLLTLMVIVWAADIAAYFAGKRFGANKLAPLVSPGKTWEGVVGGLIGVIVYFFLWFLLVRVAAFPGLERLLEFGAWLPIVFLALGAVSVLGDLFESWMKRGAGMKDSSNLLPGHGGILDRIDALTSSMPVAGLLIFVLPKS